jgi:hypothetical protein
MGFMFLAESFDEWANQKWRMVIIDFFDEYAERHRKFSTGNKKSSFYCDVEFWK